MPKLKHTIPHTLLVSEATSRLQSSLVSALATKFGDDFLLYDETWAASSVHYAFMVGSYSISLTIHVQVGRLEVNGTIPLKALPFRGQIKKSLSVVAHHILYGDKDSGQCC